MLGIIGAMEVEVEGIKAAMQEAEVKTVAGMDFYCGKISGKEVVVVKSGIGKVNAGICTQILADLFSVDAVINTGVAGSLNPAIHMGDIVIATDALEHDVDVTPLGYKEGVFPDMERSCYPADQRLQQMAGECVAHTKLSVNVHFGRVVSGDQFIAAQEKKAWLRETFHGDCTEMEGAAIAHTAWLNGLPFLIIRAISDHADGGGEKDCPEFEKMAAENSIKLLMELIQNYS